MVTRRHLAALLLACACQQPAPPALDCPLLPPASATPPPAAVARPERFDVAAIDAYVAAQVAAHGFVGLSLAIVRDGELVQQRIFAPLSLAHTSFAPPANAPGLATGYTTFSLGPPIPAELEAAGWVHAAGAIASTPTDLARWDIALMTGTLFKKPETWRAMVTPRTLASGEPSDYACGLVVNRRQGETVVSHNGAVSGFLAWNAMIPRTRSAVILLTNADHVDGGSLHAEILSLLIDADKPIPKVAGETPKAVALRMFHEYQAGEVDRTTSPPPSPSSSPPIASTRPPPASPRSANLPPSSSSASASAAAWRSQACASPGRPAPPARASTATPTARCSSSCSCATDHRPSAYNAWPGAPSLPTVGPLLAA
jgi:hypothetical protein